MLTSGNTMSVPVVTGLNDGNTGFGGDGWWIILLFIFIAAFGGWGGNGFGSNNSGAMDNYVLTSDFSQLSRQLSDATAMTERKLDSVTNGICSLGYDQLGQMNGINTNILTQSNALASQLASCCCENREAISGVNYNMATQANTITNAINNGFCQTNFNAQTNTRDIVDSQNAGTQAILNKLSQMEVNAKDDRIAELTAMNNDLRLKASQEAQNAYLVQQLGQKVPIAAYTVPNPYCNCGGCCA